MGLFRMRSEQHEARQEPGFPARDRYLTCGRFAATYAPYGQVRHFTLLFVTYGEERIGSGSIHFGGFRIALRNGCSSGTALKATGVQICGTRDHEGALTTVRAGTLTKAKRASAPAE
jgi:hypothetical protein